MAEKKANIMVCITNKNSCERLVTRGIERSMNGEGDIHVVHCVETGKPFMNDLFEADAMEYLFTAAQLANAELALLKADNVSEALVNYALKHEITVIVMGESEKTSKESISSKLKAKLTQVEFDIVH